MPERILFLTGHLARPRLEKVLSELADPGFDWSIHDIGVKVAALMTETIISRRLPRPVQANRILLPGRCRADPLSWAGSSAFIAVWLGPRCARRLSPWLVWQPGSWLRFLPGRSWNAR